MLKEEDQQSPAESGEDSSEYEEETGITLIFIIAAPGVLIHFYFLCYFLYRFRGRNGTQVKTCICQEERSYYYHGEGEGGNEGKTSRNRSKENG